MKQIRTIIRRLNSAEAFDSDVNFALREGWTLVERKVLQPPSQPNTGTEYLNTMLYAELEKFTKPDECDESPIINLIENLARWAGTLADSQKAKLTDPICSPFEALCGSCRHASMGALLEPCASCVDRSNWEPKE